MRRAFSKNAGKDTGLNRRTETATQYISITAVSSLIKDEIFYKKPLVSKQEEWEQWG